MFGGVNHWFGTNDARKQAMFDIDLAFAAGQFHRADGAIGVGQDHAL